MPHQRAVSGPLLWARAGTLGSVVMLLGSVSHVSAGGLLPHVGWLAVMLAVSTVLSARFLLQAAAPGRLVALVVAGQAMVHLGLTLSAGHRTATTPGALPAHPHAPGAGSGALHALEHAAETAPLTSDSAPSLGSATISHLVEHTVNAGPLMLVAHLCAAVAVGLWLAVGESALWTVLALTSTSVRTLVSRARQAFGRSLLPPTALAPTLALAGTLSADLGPRRRLDARVDSPRGPPQQLDVY
ncbi:MAG: hypothetical protein Q7J48_10600 [Nocardioides sp.]|nr:hypothetical protein [Nocardioides sp.]